MRGVAHELNKYLGRGETGERERAWKVFGSTQGTKLELCLA